jgi:four helix bundle suffix protein
VNVGEGPCRTTRTAQLEANAALTLLNLCCYLLDRKVAAQAAAFERDGGFTERLYSTGQVRRRPS